jgi:uncharacterized DUF497 family protein
MRPRALCEGETRTAGVPIRVGGDSLPPDEIPSYRNLTVRRPLRNPGRRGSVRVRAGGVVSAHSPRRRGGDVIAPRATRLCPGTSSTAFVAKARETATTLPASTLESGWAYNRPVIYEWDPKKADDNLGKHHVSFEEAVTVLTDPFALSFDDPDHSSDEKRFITIGTSDRNRIIFLAHADGAADRIRVISARKATKTEAHDYQESRKPGH